MIFTQPDFSIQPSGAHLLPDSVLAFFRDGQVMLRSDTLSLPRYAQFKPFLDNDFHFFELAHTNDFTIFSPHPFTQSVPNAPEGYIYREISIFRSLDYETASLITTGWHLWNWYRSNRFCGSCGEATTPTVTERTLSCPACGRMLYPVISPAIIVAITCNDRILLARNANSPFANYALVAGYVEVGETLEHAVRREVAEEVGITLTSVRYLGDQPWGVSGSHMFAFQADADDTQPIRIAKNELSDARWFDRSELEERGHAVSIAHELIERFRKGML